jgi:hypothetical protein
MCRAETVSRADCVVVQAGSCEPVSAEKQGKNREFRKNLPLSRDNRACSARSINGLALDSLLAGTGNFQAPIREETGGLTGNDQVSACEIS